jgi:ribosome-associated translation inhibitor RaiA
MKLNVYHHNLRSTHELDSLIENRILALQPRLQIDEANVRLECRFKESPAFSVRVHLVTPGPDVFAKSRGHTIRATIEKVLTQVEAKITNRLEKRRSRVRSNIQEPALLRRGFGRR